jgi:thiol-disulfide isomerase/thioredoxin
MIPCAWGQTRPANDNFVNAIQLSGSNVVVGGSNINATKEPGEPDHAGNSGGKSVWWNWRAPATGYVRISTIGSIDGSVGGPLDTVMGVYVGSSVSSLTEVASNDDGPVDVTSEVFFRTTAGTLYRIAVDGYALGTPDTAASGSIHLIVQFSLNPPTAPAWGPLPSIDGSSLSSTNFAGEVVVLNFWATWCGPCVAEIPDLINLQNNYAAAGLSVVGISIDDSTNGVNPPFGLVSSFASGQGINYPVAMSRPQGYAVETAYGGIPYIPNTFVIDRQNHIIQTFVGTQSYATFESAVLPLLYAPPILNVTVSGAMAHISWPKSALSLNVESAAQLANPAWSPVSTTILSDGVNQFVDTPLGPGVQFFRLHGP